MTSRRRFLQSAATAALPLPMLAAEGGKKLRIGLITDVHKDIIPDADARLKAFVDAMNAEKVDAVMQLGDFCIPKPENRGFLEIFNGFQGPKHHLLGNHEMDEDFTREQAVAYFGMKSRYHSFDLGGCHFVVLDSNDEPPGWDGKGYPAYIAKDQVEWLEADLAKTELNTFVFSHQSLEIPVCIDNQEEVRRVIAGAKGADGRGKVAGCFNGHWHIDHWRKIDGIPYVHINSASYYWLGSKYRRDRLPPEMAEKFPHFALTAPYREALFTVLEIDPAAGSFRLRGMRSEWQAPTPEDVGYKHPQVDPDWIRPEIREMNSGRG